MTHSTDASLAELLADCKGDALLALRSARDAWQFEFDALTEQRDHLLERAVVTEDASLHAYVVIAIAAMEEMQKHWKDPSHTHSRIDRYGQHALNCGGPDNAACSCAFSQSKSTFLHGVEAIDQALKVKP